MKTSVGVSVMVVGLVGGLGAAAVFAFELSQPQQLTAFAGVMAATLLGLVALVLKGQASPRPGVAGFRQVLTMQAASVALRLAALMIGALAFKKQGFDPMPFVLAFFAVYLLQQVNEVAFLLNRSVSNEVSP